MPFLNQQVCVVFHFRSQVLQFLIVLIEDFHTVFGGLVEAPGQPVGLLAVGQLSQSFGHLMQEEGALGHLFPVFLLHLLIYLVADVQVAVPLFLRLLEYFVEQFAVGEELLRQVLDFYLVFLLRPHRPVSELDHHLCSLHDYLVLNFGEVVSHLGLGLLHRAEEGEAGVEEADALDSDFFELGDVELEDVVDLLDLEHLVLEGPVAVDEDPVEFEGFPELLELVFVILVAVEDEGQNLRFFQQPRQQVAVLLDVLVGVRHGSPEGVELLYDLPVVGRDGLQQLGRPLLEILFLPSALPQKVGKILNLLVNVLVGVPLLDEVFVAEADLPVFLDPVFGLQADLFVLDLFGRLGRAGLHRVLVFDGEEEPFPLLPLGAEGGVVDESIVLIHELLHQPQVVPAVDVPHGVGDQLLDDFGERVLALGKYDFHSVL